MLFIIQQIDGNFIAPRVLGSSTGLPALYVIIAITVMGGIFGVPGMIIGVPVFAIIGKIISEKTESRLKAKSSGEQTAESESIVDETSVSEATAEQQNESDEAAQTVSEVEEK